MIEYSADEVHSQEVPFSSIAIPFTHDFERFDPRVDVFDDDSLGRQRVIERLLLRRQRMVFARLVRNATVSMVLQQPLITAVRQQQNSPNDRLDRRLEQLEIVDGSLGLGRAKNFLRVNVDDDLCFYRVPLFLAGVVVFLFFLGRSIGLSVTSTAIVRPAFSLVSNAFLPGK